jgi:hypothetical protein
VSDEYRRLKAEWSDNTDRVIAECMQEQGFSYFPYGYEDLPAPAIGQPDLGSIPVPLLSSDRDVVEQYGYGLYPTPEEINAGLLDRQDNDPNLAYMDSLDAAAQEAYHLALSGPPSEEGHGRDKGLDEMGCTGKAWAAFEKPELPDEYLRFQERFADIRYDLNAGVFEEWFADARVIALNDQWYGCMSNAGFLFDQESAGYGPLAAMSQALRTRRDGSVDGDQWGKPAREIDVEAKSLVGSPAEREVALADFLCREEINYLPRAIEIRIARDEQFIAEHRDDLQALELAAQGG